MANFRRILATTDFSERSLAGVRQAAALARRLGSEILLLYVVEDDLPPILLGVSDEDRRQILERHRERAARALEDYAAGDLAGLSVRRETRIGTPARRIAQVAREEECDLIVMASRGYGPVRQVLVGSTTERVLHRAHCPVMVVRVSDGEGAAEADDGGGRDDS